MVGLIIASLVGLYAIYVLIRSGGQLFGVAEQTATQKKRAWLKVVVASLALLACSFWYHLSYDSPAAQQARFEVVQNTRCTDVLEAYKAAQILVQQASKNDYTLAFAFVPTHQSTMLSPCQFIIQAPVDRVVLETGVSDKAMFTAVVTYRKDDDAWALSDLQWQAYTTSN